MTTVYINFCFVSGACIFRNRVIVYSIQPALFLQVAWYSLYGRSSTGSSVKVRLADTMFEGTGQQVRSLSS